MTTVLKLGGSLITDKDERETVDSEAIERAGAIIGKADVEELVLVHGGGSFGHKHAADFGVSSSQGTFDPVAIRTIHNAMGRLNDALLEHLHTFDVPAVPIRPFSLGHRLDDGNIWVATNHLETMIEEGFVPLLHGDVFTTAGEGATIVSGDELVVAVADRLDAERVGLCGSVPGVLDEKDDVLSEIRSLERVRAVLGESESTDVTGGMAAKVELLWDMERTAHIFDLDTLAVFLEGGAPGTVVYGGP